MESPAHGPIKITLDSSTFYCRICVCQTFMAAEPGDLHVYYALLQIVHIKRRDNGKIQNQNFILVDQILFSQRQQKILQNKCIEIGLDFDYLFQLTLCSTRLF